MKKKESLFISRNKVASYKPSKVDTLLRFTGVALLIGAIGFGTGAILKRELGQEDIDYTGFNPESFKMDSKALLKEYEKNPNKDYSPAALVNIGLEKYRQCENCYSIGVGTASTIVNQTIRNAQIKVGDHYFEESISYSSMVAIANRSTQVGENSNVKLNKGKAKGSNDASYRNDEISYAHEEYKKTWGKTLDEMFIYLISDQTVIQNESKIERSKEHIKVTLKLDPDISTYFYKIQMKKISSLDKLPAFDYLVHTYTFSKDMVLEHCYVDEAYKASMGITASIHNKINYYYHADEKIEIPSIDEQVNYSIEGEKIYE